MRDVPINSAATPRNALLASLVVVSLSTAVFPYVTGYGTQLLQLVALGAWSSVAAISSNVFADQHYRFVWSLSAVLNVLLFSLGALPVYLIFGRRAPFIATAALLAWLAFYIGCLFFLFPATDGP